MSACQAPLARVESFARWVEYHSARWSELVEQGWATCCVESWPLGDVKMRVAHMVR